MNILYPILILMTLLSTFAFAEDGDVESVQKCLSHWEQHPFHANHPTFRTLATKVKVLGIGGGITDDQLTAKPELVLVKPNVAVLSKSTLSLLNPNGWYCMKASVAVLGKSEIQLHCKAKLASSVDGATVLGASDRQGSVSVLGSTRVVRVGCAEPEPESAKK